MKIRLAKAVLRLMSWLPLAWVRALGGGLGWLGRWLPGRHNRVIRANLDACYPELDDKARARLHRANLVATGKTLLETGPAWLWPADRLLGRVTAIEGREHITAALARGRGLILAGAHLGNWEMLNLVGATLAPMVGLYRAPDDPALDRFITRARTRTGADLIASGGFAMRRMVRQLRDGGVIGMLCDQQPKQGEGVYAPFFGRPALTMTLINRLSHRTGCAVVMIECHRVRGGWRIELEPAPAGLDGDDPQAAAAILNAAVERRIRARPQDYLWAYKRFSLQPDGEDSIYRASGSKPSM